MNPIPPQNTVIPAIPNASRLAADAKKLKAESDHDHMNELAAMHHHQRWQHDCTEDARVSVKPFFANMQCAAVSLLISFAFVNPLKHEMITLEKPGAEIEKTLAAIG